MMLKKGLLVFILFILGVSTYGQYFQTGQDPASIKWRQVNTENFQLIYPRDFEKQAQKMANILEEVYRYGSYSLNHKPKKISIIFHTQTVKSNGLLAWAPRRVELYTTPHQSIYPQDWLEQLAIHEFRHVVQVDKISETLPEIISLLLGEQGAALVAGAYLPFWFLEGDAVVTETALSNFGRGRFPSFLMETQAQVVEKGIYSFDKAYLGSYNEYVPDHYKMGYYLVGGARNHFSPELWSNVVANVARKPFSFTPFRSAIKSFTGMNQKQLYEFVFDSLQTDWHETDKEFHDINPIEISELSNVYTSYRYNFPITNNSLLTYKSSFNKVSKFIIIIDSKGNEKTVLTPGAVFDESVGLTGDLLTWSEQVPDLRWEHSGRSLIHIMNIKTRERQKIFSELKGFSPIVSPDEKRVAMVEADFLNNYYLSVYNIDEKELITRYKLDGNLYIFTPKWFNNNQLIAVVLNNRGKSLVMIDPFGKYINYLTDESLGDIKHPVVKGDEIYFISSYSGKNDLYVLSLANSKIYRVYSSRFGVEYPAVSLEKKDIILSNYSSNGISLIKIFDEKNEREPLSSIKKGMYHLAEKLASQEKGTLNFDNSNSILFESKKYSKPGHLLHFHSWLPIYFDAGTYDIQPGVSLFSQNKLGTTETSLGYKWDTTEKTGKIYGKFTYKGWYPLVSLEATNGNRSLEYISITHFTNAQNEIVKSDTSLTEFNWAEATLDLSVRIPLNLTRGKFSRLFQPEIKYELTSRRNANQQPDWFTVGNINSVSYRLYYHQLLRQSYQDLVPDFGFVFDLSYRHSPGSDLELGSIAGIQMINFLPGFKPNHGFVFYNGLQFRYTKEKYTFSDIIRYPRGWGKYPNNNFMYSFSAGYKLPLIYPDLSLGGIIYLKRVKASLYADYAFQRGDEIDHHGEVAGQFENSFSSYGVELTGDMHFLRFYAPIDLGIRIGYLPEVGQMDYGFLFLVNFTSF